MRSVHHFISGKSVETASGRFGDIYNPNTGEVQAKVGLALDAEVDMAVEAAKAASGAKAYAGEKGRLVGQEAIQMHGGMGMTREMPVSSFFKRITMIDTLFGDVDHHLDRFADLSAVGRQAA